MQRADVGSLGATLAEDPGRGSFVSCTALDGVERGTAYEAVPGYPMALLVGLATDDFYADWRRETAVSALVYRRAQASAARPVVTPSGCAR